MRTDKEWMREDTWHFEVEVLRIYGRQELWSHGFGARPVSDGPYQPVDAADVRRRVAFGARQDNEFAVRHCCVHRSRWSVVSGARVPRGTSKPLATTSSASEREEAVRPQIEFSAVDLSPEKDLQHRLEVLTLAIPTERKVVRWRVVPFNACRHSVECVGVRGLGRSIGRNKFFSIFLGGILSGRAGRDNFLLDWSRVKRSLLGVMEQRGIPAKIEIFDNPLAAENLAGRHPNAPLSTPQCLLDPPSPIPSSSGDPHGPSYLQIGSLGKCLSIGHAAGRSSKRRASARRVGCYESSDWAIVPRLATQKRSKDIRPYRTSALRDTDTLLDEKDLKAKQDDVNTKRIPEPLFAYERNPEHQPCLDVECGDLCEAKSNALAADTNKFMFMPGTHQIKQVYGMVPWNPSSGNFQDSRPVHSHLPSISIPRASGKTTWEPMSTSTPTATPCFHAEISGSEPPGTPQIQQVYGAMNPLLAYTLAPMHLSAFYIPRGSGKTTWEPTSTSTSTATPCFRAEISGF
ncbi:hypothetical protein THAOC_15705 [Thalassiosira oceanica]|uniref:DUF6743 domain-containing protein n=1 Tax=Thalassiosira oceanica TaxID=159749 RepID=K0SE33_THAOC|nr:hypothetical protein THAOC_15705 [Thalassiosira oceanica]|eukprot:EJK63625.1 hypothetical protein THAOC_15705 [Thalassiosira oceanica]